MSVPPVDQMVERETTQSAGATPGDNGETTKESSGYLRLRDLLGKPFDIRSLALTGLFILAVFYTIYFTRAVLLPLVLALLLSYLLRPLIRAMSRIRIIPAVGAALVLITLIGLLGWGIAALATPATGWFQSQTAATLGGQFRLLMPFTVQGALTDIQSVSVTLANSAGSSAASSVQF